MFHCVNFDSINNQNHWWISVENKNKYQYFHSHYQQFIDIINLFSKNEPKSDTVCLIHSSGTEVLSTKQWHHSQLLFGGFGVSDCSSSSNKFENFCHCVVCASNHMMVLFLIFFNCDWTNWSWFMKNDLFKSILFHEWINHLVIHSQDGFLDECYYLVVVPSETKK